MAAQGLSLILPIIAMAGMIQCIMTLGTEEIETSLLSLLQDEIDQEQIPARQEPRLLAPGHQDAR